MSEFLDSVIAKAASDKKTIVLPEGNDRRTLRAARAATDQGIANIIVLGDPDDLADEGVDLTGIQIVDPRRSPDHDRFAQKYFEMREKKGITREAAWEKMLDELYFGAMMVYFGIADGMVSGAIHATSDVLRAALQILKTAPNTKLVSTFFVMVVPDCDLGEDGIFVFADCALNQHPTAEELAHIASASADSFTQLVGSTPTVAMLSHSTYGSAKSPAVDKVREATALAKELRPDLMIDGELQFDAAIIESVGKSKAPGSEVAGKANVLIFPDIDAGNIAYKAVQRLAKAEAYGPMTQGIAKPINDLSRGCTAEDIVGVIAITAVQAQALC
ncbi:MAG: phosphate acetyltransferase [bacterium]|nr:phosphate acetyltransferase [bacterium]